MIVTLTVGFGTALALCAFLTIKMTVNNSVPAEQPSISIFVLPESSFRSARTLNARITSEEMVNPQLKDILTVEIQRRWELVCAYPTAGSHREALVFAYAKYPNHQRTISGWTALLEQYPSNLALQECLEAAYETQRSDDDTISACWVSLGKNPFQSETLTRLREACDRKHGRIFQFPGSAFYFGWLVFLSLLSRELIKYGFSEIDWWPFASEDHLMMLRPYVVKRPRWVDSRYPYILEIRK
jgi:hypothetical protein